MKHSNLDSRLQSSSIYAVSRLGLSKYSITKTLWILVLITALSGCGFQVHRYVIFFFKYPVVINYKRKSQVKVDFPAVTICNPNRMKSMFEDCLYEPFDSLECMHGLSVVTGLLVMLEMQNFYSCNSQFSGQQDKDIEATKKFIQEYSKLNLGDRNKFGHRLTDLIVNCSFRGKSCEGPFTTITNFRYGNCFSFNKFNGLSLAAANKTLFENFKGLEITLNAEIRQYLSISRTVGFRIVIHDPSEEPNPKGNGISVSPGYETNIRLRQTLIKRLPAPYKDQCVFYSNTPQFEKSQALCTQACVQEYNYAKCGCMEPQFLTVPDRRLCNVTNSTDVCCLDSVLNHLVVHGTNCECPLPCVSMFFNELVTKSIWPSKASFYKRQTNITEQDLKLYRASHAKINIFFSTLGRTMYEQTPMFHESEIFSHLGGEFGL
ncbi:FMRFamide-activated amiloride-sensitive sodium channel [Nephila pilipes]|uniref:FMRFamide-activated amiloride-sensitive sodium channel n=1 Tax=Nephila pilipes TaxID=299642 RepID=A0A8X6IFF0_NEPPI|nr:FMRFamide-activated amiloride-sensitive sodium channel [Nephila pilipes]